MVNLWWLVRRMWSYLCGGEARVWQEESECRSQGTKCRTRCHVENVHGSCSLSKNCSTNIHNHYLSKGNPLRRQVCPLRQCHHKHAQRHQPTHQYGAQPRRSDQPQAQHGRNNRLNRGAEHVPAPPQRVTVRGVGHDQHRRQVRERREC